MNFLSHFHKWTVNFRLLKASVSGMAAMIPLGPRIFKINGNEEWGEGARIKEKKVNRKNLVRLSR